MIIANYRRTPTGCVPQLMDTATFTTVEGPEQESPGRALAWCHGPEGKALVETLERIIAA